MKMQEKTIGNGDTYMDDALLEEVLWDEERSGDKDFLKKYYQYKYHYWSLKPKHIGGKVAEHWRKALSLL